MDNAATDTDAAEEYGHERISAMKKEIDKTLIRIRKTLTKIKLGKYGICEKCRQLIDTDRLAVNPTAMLCINCQKKSQPLS
jgi:DnaK suppressor protein